MNEGLSSQFLQYVSELPQLPSSAIKESHVEYVYTPTIFDPKEYLAQVTTQKEEEFISRIINAESGWHINAKNKSSSASGLAQFIDGTFLSQCVNKYHLAKDLRMKNDPRVQIDCIVRMIRDGGASHWNASKHIWSVNNVK